MDDEFPPFTFGLLMLMFRLRKRSVLFARLHIFAMWTFHLKSDDIVTPRYFADVTCSSVHAICSLSKRANSTLRFLKRNINISNPKVKKKERIQGTSKTYDGIRMYYMGSLSTK
jgi:malate synthase